MRLLEFQAKRIFSQIGIPIPNSTLLTAPDQVSQLNLPCVLKAQIAAGGRGKAGAIKLAATPDEALDAVKALLGTTVKGLPVAAILAEGKAQVEREVYLAVLIDKNKKLPMIMASGEGGVDIERVARDTPARIIKKYVHRAIGIPHFLIRSLCKQLDLFSYQDGLEQIVVKLFDAFNTYDALLIEINPLAVTPEGLVALDAKIILDDKAKERHANLFTRIKNEQQELAKGDQNSAQELAETKGITYVPLDGNIGLISDGAGTGMLTLDLIHDLGGQAANFCELGGQAGTESMAQALEVVLANPRSKVVLVSLIGGLTRMDEIAKGIVTYVSPHSVNIPLVVRMCGTKRTKDGPC